MDKCHYPELYQSSDEASNSSQKGYVRLIVSQYALLISASILSLNISSHPLFFAAHAIVFIVSLIMLLILAVWRPEQKWYQARALAESVKTLTWRYMMRAEPFYHSDELHKPRRLFSEYLEDLLKNNKEILNHLDHKNPSSRQISTEMDRIRCQSVDDRRRFYAAHRIHNQKNFYSKRAKQFRFSFWFWITVCSTVYFLGMVSAIIRVEYTDFQIWPTEPLIVLGSSLVGWIQIKKYNELRSAYNLTSREIGAIEFQLDEIDEEEELSDFVNSAERAFSREHTQWTARRTVG